MIAGFRRRRAAKSRESTRNQTKMRATRLPVACACFADTGSQALTGRSLKVLPCGHLQGGPQVHTRRDWHTRMADFAGEVRRLMAERGI